VLTRSEVPCGRCTACCRYELVPIVDGDDVTSYETEAIHGHRVLKRRADGRCVYLGKRGCTIHERAPKVCREFDCRGLARRFLAGAYPALNRSDNAVLKAGFERLETLPR
jgi:hypothetical protein